MGERGIRLSCTERATDRLSWNHGTNVRGQSPTNDWVSGSSSGGGRPGDGGRRERTGEGKG